MLPVTILIHKLPAHRRSSASLLQPHPSAQAQVPPYRGPSLQSLLMPLHSHLCGFWSLEPYQMWQETCGRANPSSLIAKERRDSTVSTLLGDPGQEAEGQGQSFSDSSQPVPLCPYP